MGPRRRLTAAILLGAVAVAGAWLAVPRRFVIDGVSMGPALLPGDVVRTGPFPAFDRLRRPRRFERWVVAVTDALAIKRMIGLPGEEVSIVDGDLVIDGAVALKGPRLLAETGYVVHEESGVEPIIDEGWSWSRPAGEILDDASFDTGAARLLSPVRDAGLAAIVDVPAASPADPAVVRIRLENAIRTCRLEQTGRHAVVAGRLDGRLVLASWRVTAADGPADDRSCLPRGAPAAWNVTESWPRTGEADVAPALAIGPGEHGRATVVAVGRWRDVDWRPGADGRASWRLGTDEILVLGDHPPASTDSRRWGPLTVASLRYRVANRTR